MQGDSCVKTEMVVMRREWGVVDSSIKRNYARAESKEGCVEGVVTIRVRIRTVRERQRAARNNRKRV